MQCEECQERLTEYLLNELPESEAARVESHLDGGCESCADRFAELALAADWILGGIQSEAATRWSDRREAIWHKVFSRMDESDSTFPRQDSADDRRGLESVSRLDQNIRSAALMLLAMAGAFTAVVALRFTSSESRQGVSAQARLEASPQARLEASPRARLEASSRARLEASSIRSVSLHQPEDPRRRFGTIVNDPVARQIHVYLDESPQKAPGERLILWLNTADGNWTIAGELSAEDDDTTAQVIDLPPLSSPLVSIAIAVQKNESSSEQNAPGRNIAIVSGSLAEGA